MRKQSQYLRQSYLPSPLRLFADHPAAATGSTAGSCGSTGRVEPGRLRCRRSAVSAESGSSVIGFLKRGELDGKDRMQVVYVSECG